MHGTFQRMNTNLPDIRVSFPSGARWYVVRTNIRCEFRAQFGLDAHGFRTFLPFVTRWKRHARTSQIGKWPLFPRYFFVEADFNLQSIENLHRTDGVESIINNNGVPSSIYGDFILELMERQLRGQFDLSTDTETPKGFPVGGRVAIVDSIEYPGAVNDDGVWEPIIAHIERFKPNQRAELLISIMGRKKRDTLQLAQVRPAW
jgi:transcription antitermination factor NusG